MYVRQFVDPEENIVKIIITDKSVEIEEKAKVLVAVCNYCRNSGKVTRSK